jgi:DNA-binding MarR family transcriptional regulator
VIPNPARNVVAASEGSTAFLLAQLGSHAARRFTERVAELDLTLPQAGLLRAIASEPGLSQQALAVKLGTPATRLVSLIDGLEQRGFVQRKRNQRDRRLHAVHLTDRGRRLLRKLGKAATDHGLALTAALDEHERHQLHTLLARMAAHQDLPDRVHPGFRSLEPGRQRLT